MTTTKLGQLIELLADKEHDSWARWMNYLFLKSRKMEDGSVLIPADLVARWERQAKTDYIDLSETEKQSDRNEVALILPIIADFQKKNTDSGSDIPSVNRPISAINPSCVGVPLPPGFYTYDSSGRPIPTYIYLDGYSVEQYHELLQRPCNKKGKNDE